MSASQLCPDVRAQITRLKSALAAPVTNGFEALSQLGDALTQCLNFEAYVPVTRRNECQQPRWALRTQLRRSIDERGGRALRELGATGFRESRDRDLVTEVVNVLLDLTGWDFFPGGRVEGPEDFVRFHEASTSQEGFDTYFRKYRDVWLPLRARFNALASTVVGALEGHNDDDDAHDAKLKEKAQGRKRGNPNNRFSAAQKAECKKWLQQWKKAKGRMTFNAFVATFPASEQAKVRRGVRTALKWASKKKAKESARR